MGAHRLGPIRGGGGDILHIDIWYILTPGLVLMEEMDPVINGISKIGLAVRGMWGEGTEAAGNMFQVSNQITLGRREDEIIAHLEQIVLELIEHENNARIRLMKDRALVVKDHVARAFGTLSNARMVTSGVRSSWETLARTWDLRRSRDCNSSCWAWSRS